MPNELESMKLPDLLNLSMELRKENNTNLALREDILHCLFYSLKSF